MPVLQDIKALVPEMTEWRHYLHAHPELSGAEKETAVFVEEKLRSFGYETQRVGDYGIVASLQGKTNYSGAAIIMRADTDALPIVEATGVPYASQVPGVMHACGHDGHMAMLLGAAKQMKENPNFDGTVHFVFQPAEETGKGAAEMIAAGLFEKFPAQAVYGLHNSPDFPLGMMATKPGEMLSAADSFNITFSGKGGHVSKALRAVDVLATAAKAVAKLKREFNQHAVKGDKAVLVVTSMHSASVANNVMSDTVALRGTIRSFDPASQLALRTFLEETIKDAARAGKIKVEISYDEHFPTLVNTRNETNIALRAARSVTGSLTSLALAPRTLGTEDFAYMLQEKPGNYIGLGTGSIRTLIDRKEVHGLHSPKFDFNDKALAIGASYWVTLAQKALPVPKALHP